MRIGLLSDTHSYLDPSVFEHFEDCDEIWHAGDIGDPNVVDQLQAFKPLRAVYGNIDSSALRKAFPLNQRFDCHGMDVLMTHIGGYPGRYTKRMRTLFAEQAPDLYICGHSHILKVIYDKEYELLHMNPGACGHEGFHKIRTLLRFSIREGRVEDAQIIELGPRGRKYREK
ncbi:MAG: metallophosphatase family protein [Saprospiraceae bacterium]|nr:metallophosphatase family protein [Saprospiraceae bacterium]